LTPAAGGDAGAATRVSQVPVSAIFMCHGLILGGWATQVPLLRDRLSLGPAALGWALFCGTAGALMTMPGTGRATARFGAAPIIQGGAAVAGAAFVWATMAQGFWALCAALLVFGMGYGAVDVAMNAEAVRVEQRAGRALLSSVHAMWSLGAFLGSVLGAGMLLVMPAWAQAQVLAAGTTVAIFGAARGRLGGPMPPVGRHAGRPALWRDWRLLALGALLCAAFAVEGGVADWGGVYLHASRGVRQAYAAFGYIGFSLCMVAMRFAGDRVRAVTGDAGALAGGFAAAAGIVCVLAAPSGWLAIGGFGLVGLGVANAVPALFALAGRHGGAASGEAVGVVATIGYAGVLAGPPVLGAVAQATSLPVAIGVIGVMCALLGVASVWVGRQRLFF